MSGDGDAGIPHGQLLGSFSERANRLVSAPAADDEHEHLASQRVQLRTAFGIAGLVEAAATVAIFNGLVRAADGTGIQLDERVFAVSSEFRDRLGVDDYAGAANTASDAAEAANWHELNAARLFGD